jgi:hypothetical protein
LPPILAPGAFPPHHWVRVLQYVRRCFARWHAQTFRWRLERDTIRTCGQSRQLYCKRITMSVREKLRYLGGEPSVAMREIPPGLKEWLATLAPKMSAWGFPLRFLTADTLSRRPPSPSPQTRARGVSFWVYHRRQCRVSTPTLILAPNASELDMMTAHYCVCTLGMFVLSRSLANSPRPSPCSKREAEGAHILSSPTHAAHAHPSLAPNARVFSPRRGHHPRSKYEGVRATLLRARRLGHLHLLHLM